VIDYGAAARSPVTFPSSHWADQNRILSRKASGDPSLVAALPPYASLAFLAPWRVG
jgi:hypothetical protein